MIIYTYIHVGFRNNYDTMPLKRDGVCEHVGLRVCKICSLLKTELPETEARSSYATRVSTMGLIHIYIIYYINVYIYEQHV